MGGIGGASAPCSRLGPSPALLRGCRGLPRSRDVTSTGCTARHAAPDTGAGPGAEDGSASTVLGARRPSERRAGLWTIGDATLVREWACEGYDLGECREPALVGKALDLARDWLAPDDPYRDRVTDAVLAVGDGNLTNVLWDGTTCRLIDFEEFGTSDIAYELADIVEHTSSRLRRLLEVGSFLVGMHLDAAQHLITILEG